MEYKGELQNTRWPVSSETASQCFEVLVINTKVCVLLIFITWFKVCVLKDNKTSEST